MGKVITVWGSPASGKSTLAGILARHYAEKGKSTLLVSFDSDVPMLPLWLPNEDVPQSQSLGNILTAKDLSTDVIVKKIQPYMPQQNIGFIGYCAGDKFMDYPTSYNKIIETIKVMREISEVLILDTVTSLANIAVPATIEMADKVICVLTPTLKGINYYKSNLSLLQTNKFNIDNQIKVLNQVKKTHAIEEASSAVGKADIILPYDVDIENAELGGEMVNTLQFCKGKKPYNLLFEMIERSALDVKT